MRMLVHLTFPIEPFNTLVRTGKAGPLIGRILEELKPESIYFTEYDGFRGGVMVIDVPTPSDIPRIAEPWFLALEAECRFRPAMSPEDLMKSGIDAIGEKWG